VRLHPSAAHYGAERALPALPPCVHYAGSERRIAKALQLQRELGPIFDVSWDCEDGAPVGRERTQAEALAALIAGQDNAFDRFSAAGARPRLAHRDS
jgi:citrate lyase subunit beta/citryl-CoA lyase